MSTEKQISTPIKSDPNEKSTKRQRKSQTLQSTDNDENMLPSPPEPLQEEAEPAVIIDDHTPDPDPMPTLTTPPEVGVEVVITTSPAVEKKPSAEDANDDVIIVEEAPSSNEKTKPTALEPVLKQYDPNATIIAKYLDQTEDKKLLEECKVVLSALWKAMDNAVAVEASIKNTLSDLHDTTENFCELAKGHAKTLNDLISRFAKSEEEERRAVSHVQELQKLVNTVRRKSDGHKADMDSFSTRLKKLEENVSYVRDSITSGDTRANPGLKNVNFASVPLAVSGDLAPPAVIDTEDAPHHGYANADATPLEDIPLPEGEPATPCVLCGSIRHYVSNCDTYKTSLTRKEKARELSICLQCALAYTPNADGKHQDCTAATRKCAHCGDLLDEEYTLHHNAFCSFMSRRKEKREEKKRRHADAEHNRQAQGPFKKPAPSHRGGYRDDDYSRGDSYRGGYNGRGRDRRGRGRR